ncbi:MAG: CBS domain-containing protein [Pseudomonadota bacterium]
MAPCTDAMIKKDTVIVTPDQTVKEAIDLFKKHNIRNIPVVDKEGQFHGFVGFKDIYKKVLPAAVNLGKGIPNLDFIIGGAPNVAKKLRKTYDLPVSDVLRKKCKTLEPGSATWEALRIMVDGGSPVAIVEKSGKFVGIITRQTLFHELENIMEEVDREREERAAEAEKSA